MLNPLPIQPLERTVSAEVPVPGSKSLTNRALLVAGLAGGRSLLRGALQSDDTDRMIGCLAELGIPVAMEDGDLHVDGCGGEIPARGAELFVGNSGTTARFATPAAAAGHGRFIIDGVARMRLRPMGELIRALQDLGVDIRSLHGNDSCPLEIAARGLKGGAVVTRGHESSQHISGLLMAGPLARDGLDLLVEGDLVSHPFIELTVAVMDAFGVTVQQAPGGRRFSVAPGARYSPAAYQVEPDASNAGYFFAAAALLGGRVRVSGLGAGSRQGDLALLDLLEQIGCRVERAQNYIEVRNSGELAPFEVDAGPFSDMAQTLYALAPFTGGTCVVRGVAHSRLQECDRVAASAAELRRLGQEVEELPDGLVIHPRPIRPAVVQTYDDHRMAMAFALIGLRAPGIAIADPACTAKTFPDYWERLELLRRSEGG